MIGLGTRLFPFGRRQPAGPSTRPAEDARPSAHAEPQHYAHEPPRRTRREEIEHELTRAERELEHTAQAMRYYGSRRIGTELLEAECARVMRLRLELQAMKHGSDS